MLTRRQIILMIILLLRLRRRRRSRRQIILMIILLRRLRRRRCSRVYVREINEDRLVYGYYYTKVSPMRMNLPEDHFNYFRMTRTRFDDLLQRIGVRIDHGPNHRMPITACQRLAITIRFLASGDSLTGLAYSYCIAESTAASIIRETTAAIWDVLVSDFLKAPDRERWKEIANGFWERWNFPLCCGAIDGKHVAIKCPPESESTYHNYKGYFSIVLLAVVDHDYRFTVVDIGGYGSEGDAGLFRKSVFGQRLQGLDPDHPRVDLATRSYADGGLDFPYNARLPGSQLIAPHVWIGDDAFPLSRHLLKPYTRTSASGNEKTFNYRLSRARRVVENSFGILTSRWRVLDKRIDLSVSTAVRIVQATVVLHNFLKTTDAVDYAAPRYIPQHYVDYEDGDHQLLPGSWRTEQHDEHSYTMAPLEEEIVSGRGDRATREKFKLYFQSDEGRVPWQDDAVDEGRY